MRKMAGFTPLETIGQPLERKMSLTGFTLLEIMVAMIIMGMLITIALPKYGRVLERSRQAEAVTLLGNLRGSQLRYYVDNNNAYTSAITNLDIELPDNNTDGIKNDGKFFNYTITDPVPADGSDLARATRNNTSQNAGSPDYQFSINRSGNISCSTGGDSCAGGP